LITVHVITKCRWCSCACQQHTSWVVEWYKGICLQHNVCTESCWQIQESL